MSVRSYRWGFGLVAVAFLAAACSTSSPAATSVSTTTKAPASPASQVVVKSATATVSGKPTTVLTDAQGFTLYYFTPDTTAKATCTSSFKLPNGGTCATVWPPLALSSGAPTGSSSLSGTLTAVSDGNGRQVEYNGHPLYRFSGDSSAGQTNGEGLLGKWWVATPTLAPATTAGAPAGAAGSTTTTSSGAY